MLHRNNVLDFIHSVKTATKIGGGREVAVDRLKLNPKERGCLLVRYFQYRVIQSTRVNLPPVIISEIKHHEQIRFSSMSMAKVGKCLSPIAPLEIFALVLCFEEKTNQQFFL